ncbi:histidinol dehydrogenase [Alkalibacter mobilis]|uniref:histidinol dehydrogenase n=1 Tax=Alkalibacter mobilis TaxID=2787712 RepID=UPI00189FE863|nr:histidinol dehydrogenase [Alkalibacter mobilis]MBF7097816.1 histidinol dehydrogenase [Alkalibacter mobilis]
MKTIRMTIDEINQKNIDRLLNRTDNDVSEVESSVSEIISRVRSHGDAALYDYTEMFDGVKLDSLKVSAQEIDEGYLKVSAEFIETLKEAKNNIETYHKEQISNTWIKDFSQGIKLGQLVTPIDRVGLYVPGGKGGYPSTVLMDAVPAKVAGVKSIALITPPGKDGKIDPYILAAAKIAGIDEIYRIGGAHGIAALAYGTDTIPAVNKIVGPGNIYVATAKKQVFGKVDIDMIAGPSEICIIASPDSNPDFIAADLLSQAEHDEMASSMLITWSEDLAEKVTRSVFAQMAKLSRREIMEKSIRDNGKIFIVSDLDQAISLSNMIAPEHLEVMIPDPESALNKITNAGAVFLGSYTPEPIGDYFAGPNHTLPTSGTAKFSSPLGVYDFVKRSSILYYDKKNLEKVYKKVADFAEREGFSSHANAVRRRFDD